MNGVNLIPAARRHAMRRNARLRGWGLATIIYCGFILGVCIVARITWAPIAAASAKDLAQIQQRNSQLNAAIAQSRRQALEAQTSIKTTQALVDQPDWSLLLTMLGQSVGDDIVLQQINLKPDASHKSYILNLRGAAISQESASQFLLRLQDIGLFDQVKLVRTARQTVQQTQAVSFEIACLIGEPTRDTP